MIYLGFPPEEKELSLVNGDEWSAGNNDKPDATSNIDADINLYKNCSSSSPFNMASVCNPLQRAALMQTSAPSHCSWSSRFTVARQTCAILWQKLLAMRPG